MDRAQLRREHFWFLVVFSALLIFVFAVYLPDRFYWQATQGGHAEETENTMEGAAMEDMGHGEYAYHEEKDIFVGFSVDFTAAPTPILSGSPAELNFFVNEKPRGDPIDASLLQVEHEKRMHVIGVRSDLNEFFHIHPNPTSTPGVFTVRGAFSKPGVYKIWSETKKDGVIHAIGHQEFSVLGEGAVSEKIVSFGRSVISGEYQVSLELDEPVIKGREYDLSFDIHARAGKEVGFEDYLGAKMHVVVISDDLREFIHTHPEEEDVHEARGFVSDAYAHGGAPDENTGAADETVDFHVTFPRAGLYRVFAQFRPQGANLPPDEALFAGFWVRVDEKAPQQVSEWWGLFLGSLIAIALLSILVKKFIAVKPISAPKAGA